MSPGARKLALRARPRRTYAANASSKILARRLLAEVRKISFPPDIHQQLMRGALAKCGARAAERRRMRKAIWRLVGSALMTLLSAAAAVALAAATVATWKNL